MTSMKRGRGGVEYEDVEPGRGARAVRGSWVTIRYDLFLHRGERIREDVAATFRLGSRQAIAGVDYGIEGMRVGGQRRVRVGPHLAYGERGVPGSIPAGALLEFLVTLVSVDDRGTKKPPITYLRFVVHWKDPDSGRRQGLFHALGALCDAGWLSGRELEAYREVKAWFGDHLERPDRFAKSTRPHAHNVAIGWFKDSATEHVSRMYEMARILEVHGVAVEVIRTDRPGYIVYDDEHQVAAEPFGDTPT